MSPYPIEVPENGMLPSITTKRLKLRPWSRADVDALHSLWTEPAVRRYLWDENVVSREQVVDIVESAVDDLGFWCMEKKREPGLIGFCGFRRIQEPGRIELLYGLRPDHWGAGFATEAAGAALEYLWSSTGVSRVYAESDAPNYKSIAVMLRLGMRLHSASDGRVLYVLDRKALLASAT